MAWRWQVIVKGNTDNLYEFNGNVDYDTKPECVEALDSFLKTQIKELLEGEGETDVVNLEMVDMGVAYRG